MSLPLTLPCPHSRYKITSALVTATPTPGDAPPAVMYLQAFKDGVLMHTASPTPDGPASNVTMFEFPGVVVQGSVLFRMRRRVEGKVGTVWRYVPRA